MRTAFVLLLALLANGCGNSDSDHYLGYVEGDFLRVASPIAGQLIELQVARGSQVQQGAPLFVLEQEREKAAVDESTQRLNQAQAQLKFAESEYRRQQDVRRRGLGSVQQLEDARTQAQTAQGRLDEVSAQVTQARWQLTQKSQASPATGVVEDTYFRVGEWVPAGTPVVSMLPPENRFLRFFVPQDIVGSLKTGQAVRAYCDGCPAAIEGRISFISADAEFTPPVIYSREARQKLVFLVEARPSAQDALKLQPGQPVDVELVAP
jgi:HlyD family secretion protein